MHNHKSIAAIKCVCSANTEVKTSHSYIYDKAFSMCKQRNAHAHLSGCLFQLSTALHIGLGASCLQSWCTCLSIPYTSAWLGGVGGIPLTLVLILHYPYLCIPMYIDSAIAPSNIIYSLPSERHPNILARGSSSTRLFGRCDWTSFPWNAKGQRQLQQTFHQSQNRVPVCLLLQYTYPHSQAVCVH